MAKRLITFTAAALLATLPALASDRDCTRSLLQPRDVAARASLAAIFAKPAEDVEIGIAMLPAVEVVVMRIGPDGKPMYACVDSAAAAKRFLEAPIEKLPAKAHAK